MPINARAKGQRGEREVVDLFIDLMFGVETELTDQGKVVPFMSQDLRRNAAQWHAGGHDIVGIPGLAVEVKRVETEFQNAWYTQCVAQGRKTGLCPVLFFRRSRQPWQVMMPLALHLGGAAEWVPAKLTLTDFMRVYRAGYKNYLQGGLS